jgi:iron complex transport system permease protein
VSSAARAPEPPSLPVGETSGAAEEDPTPRAAPPRAWGARLSALVRSLLLVAGVALLALFSPLIGPVTIPPDQVLRILVHQATGGVVGATACSAYVSATQCHIWVVIVWNARVPAVLLAGIVGAALGVSGAGLQGVFRNPLADPYLLGLSSGATLGAAVAFAVLLADDPGMSMTERELLLPLAALVGGLVPGLLVLGASLRDRSPQTLILTGVALSALFSAVLSVIVVYYQGLTVQLTLWLLGGFSFATWTNDGLAFSVLLVTGLALSLQGRQLNLLQLGDDVARSLGSDARRVTRRVVVLATVTTAVAVAFVGVIGFVGLVAPHIVRRLLGVDYRRVLPFSLVGGALFLIIAWDIAQVAVPLSVIPVGIPTSFVGAPFFLYLLLRRRPSPHLTRLP